MTIHDQSITPRQAADRFAAEMSEDGPRKVADIIAAPDAALKFRLDGGRQWYAVRLLPDYSGFQIDRCNPF
jgi:hypothetical protein